MVIELPYVFVQTCIYSVRYCSCAQKFAFGTPMQMSLSAHRGRATQVLTYSMIQFVWTPAKFWLYFVYMYETLLYFTFFGMASVCVCPSLDLAAVLSSNFYATANLFAGKAPCHAVTLQCCHSPMWTLAMHAVCKAGIMSSSVRLCAQKFPACHSWREIVTYGCCAPGFLIPLPQAPPWWAWVFYLDPVQWTLYGLVGSQLSDVTSQLTLEDGSHQPVRDFLFQYFWYRHDFLGEVVAILAGFVLVFALGIAFALKLLNYQRR